LLAWYRKEKLDKLIEDINSGKTFEEAFGQYAAANIRIAKNCLDIMTVSIDDSVILRFGPDE